MRNILQLKDSLFEKIRLFIYRRRGMKIGEMTHVGKIKVKNCHGIIIGNNCVINDEVALLCRSGSELFIGDNSTLSRGVTVLTSGYKVEEFLYNNNRVHYSGLTTIIGNNNWICANSTIVGGYK